MSQTRWCCTVCGYVHLGEFAPDGCPVCGVAQDRFAAAAPPAAAEKRVVESWRCINCDYCHQGDRPPAKCPVCGVGSDRFEPAGGPAFENAAPFTGAIVVAGGGIAGLSAAEAAKSAAPDATVTLVCLEETLPYYRINLTRYLAGEIDGEDLAIHPEIWYLKRGIRVLTSAEVTAIDSGTQTVAIKGDRTLSYDRLVLATGAHPSVPAIDGAHRRHVVTLRTRRDAERILAHGKPESSCVVVGGGVLGLECAAALARRGVRVTVLEGFDWLLPRQLNRPAGERLAAEVRALGIELVGGARINAFDGDERVRSVLLENGRSIPAELVVVATGVRSNSYLARLAGLEVGGGVLVDRYLRSSDPHIYAAGDIAEHQGVLYGTWGPAQHQGTIAGLNAAGEENVCGGFPRANSLKVLGTDLFSIGQVHPEDGSYLQVEDDGDKYRQFTFRDGRLVGAILLGDTALAPTVKRLIEGKESCADLLAAAADGRELCLRIGALA